MMTQVCVCEGAFCVVEVIQVQRDIIYVCQVPLSHWRFSRMLSLVDVEGHHSCYTLISNVSQDTSI